MTFEWDNTKNVENIRKHQIDFADAWRVFDGPLLVRIDDRFNYGEVRSVGLGFLFELVVVIVFTERDNDIIRVISLRRALKYEREKFYKFLQDEFGPIAGDE